MQLSFLISIIYLANSMVITNKGSTWVSSLPSPFVILLFVTICCRNFVARKYEYVCGYLFQYYNHLLKVALYFAFIFVCPCDVEQDPLAYSRHEESSWEGNDRRTNFILCFVYYLISIIIL
ncbi:hypothetical protein AABB24_020326 [Solanum stoloniferum]|uniref:Uncharacterized protein n=1 Tax=Solanum stoloniferum TaxID=62892 RepID=A0ABD2T7H6_9SOLN